MTQAAEPPSSATVDKRGERVRAMFAGVAKRYDLLNHLLSLNIDKRWRRHTTRVVPPSAGDLILDVCTGTGDLALEYDRAVDGQARIVGSDFCHEMLVIAQDKNRRRGRAIQLIEADGLALPFSDDTFDIVTVAFGLRNMADTGQGLAEMIRVARPGGRVAVLEFSRPRIPILRWCYLTYFKHVLPRVGQGISRSNHDAYHYLPASVLQFPDGKEMTALLESMGLVDIELHRLTFGVATLYVGRKPPS